MSISTSLTNVFTDAYCLIEANLTPFEINNMRHVLRLPLIDLKTCTVPQILKAIEDGVDFREMPTSLNKLYFFGVGAFISRIQEHRADDPYAYEWIGRFDLRHTAYIVTCLLNNTTTEARCALVRRIVEKYCLSRYFVDNECVHITLQHFAEKSDCPMVLSTVMYCMPLVGDIKPVIRPPQ